jgi:hypothetical protein
MKREIIHGMWALGIIIILASFIVPWPWYGIRGTAHTSIGTISRSGTTTLVSDSYTESDIDKGNPEKNLGYSTLFFLLLSSAIGGIGLLYSLKGFKKAGYIAILSVFLIIIGLVLYTALMPSARLQGNKELNGPDAPVSKPSSQTQFWGSNDDWTSDEPYIDYIHWAWGPEIGYFVAFIGLGFQSVVVIVILWLKEK